MLNLPLISLYCLVSPKFLTLFTIFLCYLLPVNIFYYSEIVPIKLNIFQYFDYSITFSFLSNAFVSSIKHKYRFFCVSVDLYIYVWSVYTALFVPLPSTNPYRSSLFPYLFYYFFLLIIILIIS